MLTPEELTILESLCSRARHATGADRADLAGLVLPGDVVQLRPGTDLFWQTSLLIVGKVRDDGGISGTILRPHRAGYREAWYTFRPPEVILVGRPPFP